MVIYFSEYVNKLVNENEFEKLLQEFAELCEKRKIRCDLQAIQRAVKYAQANLKENIEDIMFSSDFPSNVLTNRISIMAYTNEYWDIVKKSGNINSPFDLLKRYDEKTSSAYALLAVKTIAICYLRETGKDKDNLLDYTNEGVEDFQDLLEYCAYLLYKCFR